MARAFVEIFDKNRRKIGILQNAYKIREEKIINAITYLYFSLPFNDPKNELCQPFYYVRYNNGEMYRILPSRMIFNERGDFTYTCEHVIAMLIDNVMFGQHIVGNVGYYTSKVINYVLSKQLTQNWILGRCDFNRQFEYAWEQETLLSALWGIPKPFTSPYIWTFDTHIYPFVLNLELLDTDALPQMYIRSRKNLLSLSKQSDPTSICTRLYPLGEGEGINQLTIKDINNGIPYLQSPQEYIDKYGVIERVWIDRRYTNIESLKEAASSMLEGLQEPYEKYDVEFAMLGTDPFDIPEIGKIVEIVDTKKKTYVTGIKFDYEELQKSVITIANKPKDIAGTIADMMDRQRIEMSYAQGATQIFMDNKSENATPTYPLLLKIMFPESMKIINAVTADIDISGFRKPFTVTGGAGGATISQQNTTSSGSSTETTTQNNTQQTSGSSSTSTTDSGGSVNTSSGSGGGAYQSTESGGGQTSGPSSNDTSNYSGGAYVTSDSVSLPASQIQTVNEPYNAANHNHGISANVRFLSNPTWRAVSLPAEMGGGTVFALSAYSDYNNNVTWVPSGAHNHGAHNHSVTISGHTHSMPHTHNISAHNHNINLQNHTHTVTIGSHNHNMAHTHSVPSHNHSMSHTHNISHTHTIGDHTHQLNAGISTEGSPTMFTIRVNGIDKSTVAATTWNGDITPYLLNTQKKIDRGRYYRIEIVPNTVAYVQLTITIQGFIQSRGNQTL